MKGLPVFVDVLSKVGARKNLSDREHLQKAHDHVATITDCVHCAATVGTGDTDETMPKDGKEPNANDVGKRGARHSKKDLSKIKDTHDTLVALGARCEDFTKP